MNQRSKVNIAKNDKSSGNDEVLDQKTVPQFDNLLRKMLSTPPKPHPKPAKKAAKKKTAK